MFQWEGHPCTHWNRFICEIPAKQLPFTSDTDIMDDITDDYVIERQCPENVGLWTVRNCFYFVKLQYNQQRAQEFCQKRWNASLASVEAVQKQNFLPMLEKNLGDREEVQPRIPTEVLGQSLIRLLVSSHRSVVCLLRTTRFACALRCAHSFPRSLTSLTASLVEQRMIGWLFILGLLRTWFNARAKAFLPTKNRDQPSRIQLSRRGHVAIFK